MATKKKNQGDSNLALFESLTGQKIPGGPPPADVSQAWQDLTPAGTPALGDAPQTGAPAQQPPSQAQTQVAMNPSLGNTHLFDQAIQDQQQISNASSSSGLSSTDLVNGVQAGLSDYSGLNIVGGIPQSSGGFAGITTINGQNIDTTTVYTGKMHMTTPMHLPKDMGIPTYETSTIGSILRASANLSESDMLKLQNQLAAAGLMNKKDVSGFLNKQFISAYGGLLSDAAMTNNPTITPSYILQQKLKEQAAGDMSSTSTNYNFTSPMAATYYGDKAAQSELGQNLSQDQAQQYYAALHSAEQANPQVSTTTYATDPNTGFSTPSKSTDKSVGFAGYSGGGAAETQLATDFAQTQPGWANFQASTTLMDEVFKMLAGRV